MMKRRCLVLLFVFSIVSLLPLFAATANSVWEMTVASTDAAPADGKLPPRGAVFKDAKGSRFIVSKTVGDTVVFDRYWSSNLFEPGEELARTHTLFSLRGFSTLRFAGAQASCVVPFLYPFQPFVMGGISFGKLIVADAGVMVSVPLSNLMSFKTTFVRNAALEGWAGCGLYGKNFSVVAGIDYRHAIKYFVWSIGAVLVSVPVQSVQFVQPRISLGVAF